MPPPPPPPAPPTRACSSSSTPTPRPRRAGPTPSAAPPRRASPKRARDHGRAHPGAEPRLLVFFLASESESAAASASRRARLLEACYDAIADVAPTLDLIPLLPSLGWDAASVALELVPRDAEWRCAAVGEGRANAAAAAAVSARADPRGGFRPLVPIDVRDAETTKTTKTTKTKTKTTEALGRTPDATWSAALRAPPGQRRVSVGGTFDRMHAGHRLLLAAAALATWGSAAEGGEAGRFEEGGDRAAEDRAEDRGEDPSGAEDREEDAGCRRASSSADASDATLKRPGPTLFVGVTGPALLGKKARAELLEPYEVRASSAETFARACVRASDEPSDVRVGPLDASPPLAATTRAMTALVTSRETAAGGAAISDARREAGFEALALLEVGLVGGGGGGGGGKLSSSALRDAEARRRTDGDGDADEVNTKG